MLAGLLAIASGLAYLAYWLLPARPEWAIVAWNLLIVPPALLLGTRLASRGLPLASGSTAAGIAASLLWAAGHDDPVLEPWWIGLAAVWWLGIGWLLLPGQRATGILTLALGVAAALDFFVTLLDVGQPMLGVAGLKLPLTMVWSLWIGFALILEARRAQFGRSCCAPRN